MPVVWNAAQEANCFVRQEETLRKRCPTNHADFAMEGSVRTEEYGARALSFLHRPAAAGKEIYVLEEFVAEEPFQDGME